MHSYSHRLVFYWWSKVNYIGWTKYIYRLLQELLERFDLYSPYNQTEYSIFRLFIIQKSLIPLILAASVFIRFIFTIHVRRHGDRYVVLPRIFPWFRLSVKDTWSIFIKISKMYLVQCACPYVPRRPYYYGHLMKYKRNISYSNSMFVKLSQLVTGLLFINN